MHEFLICATAISGWECGQFAARHWITPWLERKLKATRDA